MMVAAARCPLHGIGLGRLPLALPTRWPPCRGLERPCAPPRLESGCAVGSGLDSGLESAPGDQMSAGSEPRDSLGSPAGSGQRRGWGRCLRKGPAQETASWVLLSTVLVLN